jgi:hypothetical protein
MSNDDIKIHTDLHVRALVNAGIITGAIPKTMYGSYTNDPRMPVFANKPDWEIEVNFD